MMNDTQPKRPTTFYRASLAVAALLIVFSVWLTYELVRLALFFAGAAELLGRPDAVQWANIAIELAAIGIVGIILPGFYLRWGWPRAFPKRSFRSAL